MPGLLAAVQHLPPRQRAVLILCEVLRWKAAEVAELLDTSVASINSALQRARSALAPSDLTVTDQVAPLDAAQCNLLDRYVKAFEQFDMAALVAVLHKDATLSMLPYDPWLRGPAEIVRWMLGPGEHCRGSRLVAVAVAANGSPAFGSQSASSSARRAVQHHPATHRRAVRPRRASVSIASRSAASARTSRTTTSTWRRSTRSAGARTARARRRARASRWRGDRWLALVIVGAAGTMPRR